MITGVLFSLLQGILAYFAFRYGDKGGDGARYWIRPRLEKRFALIVGIIIFGVDVTLFALGDSNWFRAWRPSPPGHANCGSHGRTVHVEFFGMQARTVSLEYVRVLRRIRAGVGAAHFHFQLDLEPLPRTAGHEEPVEG